METDTRKSKRVKRKPIIFGFGRTQYPSRPERIFAQELAAIKKKASHAR